MNLKYIMPLPLSAIVWSGYVMFDMYEYYINYDGIVILKGFIGFIGLVVFSLISYVTYRNELLDFGDEELQDKGNVNK